MEKGSISTTQTGSAALPAAPQACEALKAAIQNLAAVFQADYGEQWRRQFHVGAQGDEAENMRQWKRRAWTLLKPYEITSIIDGYDIVCDERRPYMPDLRDLEAVVRRIDFERKSEKDHIRRIEESAPGFSGLDGYVTQVLAPAAKGNPIAERELEKMKAALYGRRPAEGRDERLAENERILSAQIESARLSGKLPPGPDLRNFRCAYPGCGNAGTRSGSISGGKTWYCGKHYHA